MRPEVAIAAHWWGDRLRESSGDDPFSLVPAARRMPLPEAVVARFEAALAERIEQLIEPEYWRPNDPSWGSLHRTFGVGNYDPDAELRDAGEEAGITDLSARLPYHTVMSVNPGQVRVGWGYREPFRDIWTACSPGD